MVSSSGLVSRIIVSPWHKFFRCARLAVGVPEQKSRHPDRCNDEQHSCLTSSRDRFRLAQAFDQRRAQEKGAREFWVLRSAAQLVVVLLAHGRVLLREHALVADGLGLGVLQRDMAALA